ncbi:tryptophan synthase subunit beta [Helicobacter winghamensis]|uniref:Tryptophan synthase beta chain n=1 Tax=Helicobacter winghamensis TaxID=157268 RepID=A0A2N3PJJ7_9HELI|nr:tryptophan synthase subunit beta [Helicobacter winghamensis]EEO26202.1 tryptophan synthase, beta subunit [Helicobacter winghamensis ATCC BAA-430]PKT77200.1 tryptophan synthase subunit beta [Helicobacter winghamensis]PKT77398.1 tryptophan synthase subunit beta [Helicobacter winghamensis]PKT77868.1 tryptophan synthase subunit beta [Helicobacter winghamensis]PKT81365.1 tryptophan synthase subunit beta [Helicobacter winghamensis]
MQQKPYLKEYPNAEGFFGKFGGSFVPDAVKKAMDEINVAYDLIAQNSDFITELRKIRKHFQGRPTPIYFAHNLTKKYGGAGIYLKREDLNHTGAHKLNHCMGEALLAKFMGKKKLIAETGAGQHGVAIATAAAYFGLECEIHMGEVDIAKEHPNVIRMKILGAKVIPVSFGAKTLKEAVDSAFEAYLQDLDNSIYAIGSVVGPHPFPKMVRDFQAIIGVESREQFLEMTGELPDIVTACVGGGSNAMGIFSGFIDDCVELVGIEPLGLGSKLGQHAASLSYGSEGVMHGFNSIILKDSNGEPAPVYSVASGLDYPSVGPEHAYLNAIKRTKVATISDKEAIDAFFELSKNEGIIPAIESSHAVAYALKIAPELKGKKILVNLSGRGDKDIDFIVEKYGYGE